MPEGRLSKNITKGDGKEKEYMSRVFIKHWFHHEIMMCLLHTKWKSPIQVLFISISASVAVYDVYDRVYISLETAANEHLE